MRCPTPKAPGGSAGCAQGPFSGRSNALSGGLTGQVCSVSFPSILMLTFPAAHRDAEHPHAECAEPPRPPPPPAGAPAQHTRPWRLLVAPGRTFHSAVSESLRHRGEARACVWDPELQTHVPSPDKNVLHLRVAGMNAAHTQNTQRSLKSQRDPNTPLENEQKV